MDGSYPTDLLPGLLISSLGLGAAFVSVTTAANANVPPDQAGLAAALLNASQQLGGALGLAIFTAVATSRTNGLIVSGRRCRRRSPPGSPRAARVQRLPGRRGRRRAPRRQQPR